jgi:hypothetical protein
MGALFQNFDGCALSLTEWIDVVMKGGKQMVRGKYFPSDYKAFYALLLVNLGIEKTHKGKTGDI